MLDATDTFRPHKRRTDLRIWGLAFLSAMCAELLAAYADSTGRPLEVLFSLVFFAALYGAPALLAREFARRAGWGWPSLIMLTLALAIMQGCVIDQSLFAEDYGGYTGWEESRRATFIPYLSISAIQIYTIIIGHVIFSFAGPIAVAEAWRPQTAQTPWLETTGIIVALVAYGATSWMIVWDDMSHNASPVQLTVSILLVVLCVAAAWLMGSLRGAKAATRPEQPRSAWRVLATMMLPAMVICADVLGDSWGGAILNTAATGAIGVWVAVQARRPGWGPRHAAAVALAFLIARGLWAFTYFPLLGSVGRPEKYAHNVVMLAAVICAGWLALRPDPRLDRRGR